MNELRELDEAIKYLFDKKSEAENINFINSQNSLIVIDDPSSLLEQTFDC